jgi:hypothetical protein
LLKLLFILRWLFGNDITSLLIGATANYTLPHK